MRGFPPHVNTKMDVDNLRSLYPEETQEFVQRLLDSREVWQEMGLVTKGQLGVTDEKHMVVDRPSEDGKAAVKVQMELKEDVNYRLYQLGFSREDAEKMAGLKPDDPNQVKEI